MTAVLPDIIRLRTPPPPDAAQRDIWKTSGWSPHALQQEVLLDRRRNRVVAAGRRAGKSETGGHLLVPEAFRALLELKTLAELGKRREYWIVGPEYSDAEKEFRVVYNTLVRLGFDKAFDHPGTYNNPHNGEMLISMWQGRFQIHAKSAKYPNTLVGEGLSGVVFSEAAKLKLSVWTKFLRPTLADFRGWSFFGSTPEGRNWFYELYQAGQDPDRPSWGSWRAPSWVNPYVYGDGVDEGALKTLLDLRKRGRQGLAADLWNAARSQVDDEILSMFDDMSAEMFQQEVMALFTEYVGRVFKDFDEEYHVNDVGLRAGWDTYACTDYGFSNPFVWLLLQIDPHRERIHIVGEYYEIHRTTEEAATEIRSRGLAPSGVKSFFPDPAEPDRTRELSGLLRIPSANPGSLEIKDRVEWIRRKLRMYPEHLDLGHPDRFPWLTINRRCVNTIREFNIWKYKETYEQATEAGRHAPENPEKKNDHTPEALGRFMSGFFGSPWAAAQTRQTQARVTGRRGR